MAKTTYESGLLSGLGYQPKALTRQQLMQESGAKQFNRNGTVVTSEQGATGIAQVMPETGPEAAKDAGLPWDPQRFKNDAEYNLRLGDAYQAKLLRMYGGDKVKAKAAYHQGPTNMNRAIQRADKAGGDWRDYIGPKGQAYIGHKSKGRGKPMSDGFVESMTQELGLNPQAVGLPTAGESTRFNGTDNAVLQVSTPGQIPVESIKADLKTQGDLSTRFMQSAIAAIEPIKRNAAAITQKTAQVATTKENLYNDFQERANQLEAKMTPLLERREALANRLIELDAMSPLERRFKAAFNGDYDQRIIRGRMERVNTLIETQQANYKDLNAVRSGVAQLSVEADAADTETLAAHTREVLADSNIVNQAISAVGAHIDAGLLPMKVQTETLRLEAVAKNSILGNATTEQVTKWFGQAQESGTGTVVVDGTTLSVGELQTASRQAQTQELSFRNLQNATQVNDLQMKDTLENEALERMTPEQLQSALQNGGTYNGHTFPASKLATAVAARTALQQTQVNDIIMQTAPGQASDTIERISSSWRQYGARVTEMFGTAPQDMVQFGAGMVQSVRQWSQGREQAAARGVEEAYISSTMPVLQGIQTKMNEHIEGIVNRWGGGKPELKAVASAYINGQPLNGEAALKGLISMARSGMPAGAKMSGPALAAIQEASAIVRAADSRAAGKSGDAFEALMSGGSKAEKETELVRRVQQAVSSVYADHLSNAIMNDLPSLARQVRDERSPDKQHPFAKVERDTFMTAVRHGDAEGYATVGNQIGLNSRQTQRMFAEGPDGVLWQAAKKAKGLSDSQFGEFQEQLQAVQMTSTLQALDAGPRVGGQLAGKAYVDFLRRSETIEKVGNIANGYGKSSFGAFLVSNSAGGGYRDAWNNYADGLQVAYQQLHATELRERITQQRGMMGDPYVRMGAVLSASQLSKSEQSILLDAVRPIAGLPAQSATRMLADRNFQGAQEMGEDAFDKLAFIVKNRKLDDPAAERIRAKAAKNWDEMDAVVGNIFNQVGKR